MSAKTNSKTIPAHVWLDEETAAILDRLAARHEGNRSAAIRSLIRQAAGVPAETEPAERAHGKGR